MIIISEHKEKRKSIFRKTVIDDETGVIRFEREIDISLSVETINDMQFYVLFDEEMQVIEDAYIYLNNNKKDASQNTRKTIATALRLLYSFLSLFNFDIRQLDIVCVNKLKCFLRGIDSNPDGFRLTTIRSNKTVNIYLGIYREFFRAMGIQSDALFNFRTVNMEYAVEGIDSLHNPKRHFVSNLPESSVNKNQVPKHIKPDEFKKIYLVAMKHNDEQAMVILYLMYGYGLRIGEVLGLTIEDIIEKRVNGKLVPFMTLRNRKSDSADQHCKGLMTITSKKQYGTSDYTLSKHEIAISYDLFDRLLTLFELTHSKYMDLNHPSFNQKAAMRYDTTTEADIVTKGFALDQNRYLFLNSCGRPLSHQSWDDKLASYMKEAGVSVDRSVGKNSLSHRFRHGFAMFHAHYRKNPVNMMELMRMMRHKSISSTTIYFNLTIEEEYQIQKDFQEELFAIIPELKEGIDSVIGDYYEEH